MLTDSEFNNLLKEEKYFEDNSEIVIDNNKIMRNLKALNSKNEYILNIQRGRIELSKVTYQTRHKQSNTRMLRIDTSSGARHFNPDGTFVPCPHIHIYKEGYNDKWAYYLDANKFKDIDDLAQVLKDFLNLLNIKHIPPIILKLGLI